MGDRVDYGLRNAQFALWASGEPVNWDFETSNATTSQLTREQGQRASMGIVHPAVSLFPGLNNYHGEFVKPGYHAVRFANSGAWAANSNGIHIGGVAATLLGTPEWTLPWVPGQELVLGVWIRGTEDKEMLWKVGMADDDGDDVQYLEGADLFYQWGSEEAGGPVFKLTEQWQLQTLQFTPVLASGTSGGDEATNLLFGIFNSSTAAATPNDFIFDVGGFEYDIRGSRSEH